MATRGTPLNPFTQARILRLRSQGVSIRGIARELGIDRWTVRKYTRGLFWAGRPVTRRAA